MEEDETIRDRYSWWRQGAARPEKAKAPDVYDVYARLSYNLHNEKESCERQVEDCLGMAARMGLAVGETWVDDSLSAWRDGVRRPGWEACLKRIKNREIRGVIVWHGDRFIRKPPDLISLLEAAEGGAVIHSCGSGQRDLNNPEHRRVMWYEVIHADASSEDTSRRVKRGLQAAAEKGRPAVGRRGYGYGVPTGILRPDGREVIDKRQIVPEEAKVIREAARCILAGASMNSVCQDLAHRGVPTSRGGKWEIPTLRRILSSPRIAGLRVHQGRIIGKADWEPILDEATWRQLQAALGRGVPPQRHPDREYLVARLVVCVRGSCGARMASKPPSVWEGVDKKTGRLRRSVSAAVYRCRSGVPYGGCGRNQIQVAKLDGHVAARLRVLAADPAAMASQDADAGRDADAAELAQVEEDLMALAQDWGRQSGPGRMTYAEYGLARAGLAARQDELKVRLAGQDRPSPAAAAGGLLWDQMDYTRRRAFAEAVIDTVVVRPAAYRGEPVEGRVEIRWRE